MITIERLTASTPTSHLELAALASELHDDSRTISREALDNMLAQQNTRLVVARDDDKIIGMAGLYLVPKIGSTSGLVEDVIVDAAYRGQGLGEKLMRTVIEIGRDEGLKSIFLTSRSVRAAAHKLYTKLGFAIKETNVFKLTY